MKLFVNTKTNKIFFYFFSRKFIKDRAIACLFQGKLFHKDNKKAGAWPVFLYYNISSVLPDRFQFNCI